MDGGLGKHGVVLKLTLTERRSVGGDDDQLGLAGTQGLDGGLVTQGDCCEGSAVSHLQNFILSSCSRSKRKKRTLSGLHHKRKARVDVVTGLLALVGHRYAVEEDELLN